MASTLGLEKFTSAEVMGLPVGLALVMDVGTGIVDGVTTRLFDQFNQPEPVTSTGKAALNLGIAFLAQTKTARGFTGDSFADFVSFLYTMRGLREIVPLGEKARNFILKVGTSDDGSTVEEPGGGADDLTSHNGHQPLEALRTNI